MTLPIIIDTDPGIDDAAALSVALLHPFFDVKMISTVNGNVSIENDSNALKLKVSSIVTYLFTEVLQNR